MTAHGNSAGHCMRLAPSLRRGHTAHASLPSHSTTKGLSLLSRGTQGTHSVMRQAILLPSNRTRRLRPAAAKRVRLHATRPTRHRWIRGMCRAFRYVQLHQALNACADASGTANSQAAHCNALADSSGTREGLAVPPISDALCKCRAIPPTERSHCRASERFVWLCD